MMRSKGGIRLVTLMAALGAISACNKQPLPQATDHAKPSSSAVSPDSRELVAPLPKRSISTPTAATRGAPPANQTNLSLPLVDCSGEQFVVDPEFHRSALLLARLNSLSYLLSNCKMLQINPLNYFLFPPSLEEAQAFSAHNCQQMATFTAEITPQGWEYQYFIGKSGQTADDIPGLVAFNRSQATIVVVFRGGISAADFRTDLDERLDSFPELAVAGTLHKGFVIKYKQLQVQLYQLLDYYLHILSAHEKSQLKFYITGHSLGAALGSIGIADITHHYGPLLFGQSYRNSQEHRFKAWLLSTPVLCGNGLCRDSIHSIVGKKNILAEFVRGDPVPLATPGINKLFTAVTAVPAILSETSLITAINNKYALFEDKLSNTYPDFAIGVQAIQSSLRTVLRTLEMSSNEVVSAPAFIKKFPAMAVGGLHYGTTDKFGNGTYDYRLVDRSFEALLESARKLKGVASCAAELGK